jgi:mannose-6-phosphate isomerase-like protein (cupin superfamily)
MARAGEQLFDPVRGDSIEFRETARDTGGALLSWVWTAVGAPPMHVHPLQEERFEVLSGTVGIQIEDEQLSLGEGEEATVAPGTPHRWYSVDDQQKARFLAELRPALNTEILLETLYGLATDGKTDKRGVPNLLQMAVILNGLHKGEIYLATPPIALQKVLFALLSPVGKLVGYRDHYPKYSGADTPGEEGAGPPSTTSVMARGVAMAASLLLVASLFLVGRMRRRNKG